MPFMVPLVERVGSAPIKEETPPEDDAVPLTAHSAESIGSEPTDFETAAPEEVTMPSAVPLADSEDPTTLAIGGSEADDDTPVEVVAQSEDKGIEFPPAMFSPEDYSMPVPDPPIEAESEMVPPKPIRIEGYLDGLEVDGTIHGWACVPSLDEAVVIEIFKDGLLVATGFAEQPRPDVAAAGMGNELSGFMLPLPEHLFDGALHGFEVWAKARSAPAQFLGETHGVVPLAALSDQPIRQEHAPLQPLDEREEAVEQVRSEYLEEMLATALTRVDELEQSERSLHDECGMLRRQLAVLSERVVRDVRTVGTAPHRTAPGAFDGSAVRMMSVTRRRDAWLDELTAHGVTGSAFALGPHDGLPGPLAILVWGSGGIGDILYLTTVVRELARLYKDSTVFVLHENGAVDQIFAANPYAAGTIWLQGATLQSFVRTCHSLDVFDLIAEVRYAVTYSAPPLSRAPMDFLRPASYRAAEWQTYVRYRWPHLNNLA
jgi:hypothetical protein